MDSLAYDATEAQPAPAREAPLAAPRKLRFLAPQNVALKSAGEDARRTLSSPA